MKKYCLLFAVLSAVLITTSCASTDEEPEVRSEQPNLQLLILQGRYDEAKSLFFTDLDVNQPDVDKNTALHVAASMGSVDMIEYLIARGADTTLRNRDGNTPIHIAIMNRKYDAIRALAESGKTIFATDKEEKNALDLIFEIDGELLYNSVITPKTLHITNDEGQTLVHYFILNKNLTAIQKCASLGVDLSVENAQGLTPLELAMQDTSNIINAKMAAELIKAKCEPMRGEFSYFEDTVRTYNVSLRFANNRTPLHMAASYGHLGIAQYLLENGAQIEAQGNFGATPLHTAVEYGHTMIAKLLLENGANVNARDQMGRTPLLSKISRKQQLDMYTALLNYKADVQAKDIYGNTPLHNATISGVSSLILNRLVKEGADVDARNEDGVTPLALAVENELIDQISFFVNLNADINAKDKMGESPLTKAIAIATETKNLSVLQALITPNNVNARDANGETPLHQAVRGRANKAIIQYIANSEADLNARNANGDSILYSAVEMNNKEAGVFLIDEGADIYSRNSDDFSPLRLAMVKGGDIRDWFMSKKVINGSDGNGNTPLHYAAEWKYDENIKYIIAKGGDINKKNAVGQTPLHNAAKENSASTIKLIIENGANPNARDLLNNTPLHQSVQWNTLEATKVLISMGAIVDAKNTSGKTPLAIAAIYDSADSAKILLENKANVNSSDITGKTVLMEAVQQRSEKVIPVVLAYGANVNAQDMYGRNAYHEAAEIKDREIIRVLAAYGGNALSRDSFAKTPFSLIVNENMDLINFLLGSDKNLSDSDGNNPLHIAILCKVKADTMTGLIQSGYDINQRNSKGLTPLNYAIIQRQNNLAKILIQNNADPFVADNNGDCAITLAFNSPEVQDILDALLRKYATTTDFQGDTILHYAARSANEETLKHILTFGLNKNATNNNGETPYEVARRWNNQTAIKLLK